MTAYGANGVHPDHHAFWGHPTNPNFIIEGNDGGLNIYKKKTTGQWRRQGGGREALPDDIEVVGHIPYTKNTLVAFLNTVDSIHGVTPRNNPNTVRRYVNIDCHVQEKLFKFGEDI